MDATCQRCRSLLSAAMDDELTPGEENFVRQHVLTCEDCREAQAAYGGIRRQMRTLTHPAPPAALRAAVFTAIREDRMASRAGARLATKQTRPNSGGWLSIFSTGQKLAVGIAAVAMVFFTGLIVYGLLRTTPFQVEEPVANVSAQTVTVVFSRPLDKDYVIANAPELFKLTDEKGNKLDIEWDKIKVEGDRVELPVNKTTTPLNANEKLQVEVKPDIRDEAGTKLNNPGPKIAKIVNVAPTATNSPRPVETTPVPPSPTTGPTNTAPPPTTTPVVTTVAPTTAAPTSTPEPATTAVVNTTVAAQPPTQVVTTPPNRVPTVTPTPPNRVPTVTPVTVVVTSTVAPSVPPATVTATPVVTPTVVVTPTATVAPTPTFTPVVTPTETPAPTTVAPTTAAPTTVATCPVEVRRGFGKVYNENPDIAARIGCPSVEEAQASLAYENFQRGFMLWHGQTGLIFVFYNNGTWQSFSDPGSGSGGTPTPTPSGTGCSFSPVSGFGYIWAKYPNVRNSIGCPTNTEAGTDLGAYQPFARGRMFFNPLTNRIYVLYSNGSYVNLPNTF